MIDSDFDMITGSEFDMIEKLNELAKTQSFMNKAYADSEDLPYELFLSAMAMLIERRVANEGRDIYEEMDNLVNVCHQINDEMGETSWR